MRAGLAAARLARGQVHRYLSSGKGVGVGAKQRAGQSGSEGGYGVDLLTVAGSKSEKPFMLVNSYFRTGFRVSGITLEGSVCIAPHASFLWKPRTVAEISVDSLRFIPLLEPSIEIVVLGCGRTVQEVDPSVRRWLDKQRIALEVHTSPNACATFNFLNQEQRRALAALIPLEATDSRG
jgi:NADH dehydrogenase [ubiquinone] 1 alpha subcomplex assembly factor 3